MLALGSLNAQTTTFVCTLVALGSDNAQKTTTVDTLDLGPYVRKTTIVCRRIVTLSVRVSIKQPSLQHLRAFCLRVEVASQQQRACCQASPAPRCTALPCLPSVTRLPVTKRSSRPRNLYQGCWVPVAVAVQQQVLTAALCSTARTARQRKSQTLVLTPVSTVSVLDKVCFSKTCL